MIKNWSLILLLNLWGIVVFGQTNPADTSLPQKEHKDLSLIDTSLDYNSLFDEMTSFLDSISSPHSYTLAALSFSKGYFNYASKDDISIRTARQMIFTPTAGYYHKSGLGITGMASFVNDQSSFTFYQFAATPSYDYLANKNFATGFSYTRYFTRDSLAFYTSPLQNELLTYFMYRKWWFKPMLSLSYGWGSRSAYQQRETLIQDLRLRRRGFTRINTKESVSDLSLITSVRHDFYWLDVFTYNDHFRITPQLNFTAGSQKFGFNQSSNTYGVTVRNGTNILYNSDNVSLDDKLYFQPLSLTFYLRTEYAIGKFYLQPQMILDYYFPASDKKFTGLFSINAGFMF